MKSSSAFSNQIENDLFLDILTLGLITKLKKTEAISSLNIEKRIPCNRLTISSWEQNNGVRLPPDLKEFYASTDGFSLTWKYYNYDKERMKGLNITISGEIKIYPLTNLHKLHFENQKEFRDSRMHFYAYHNKMKLPSASQLEDQHNLVDAYILSHHFNVGTVCLVYYDDDKKQNTRAETNVCSSSIWLLDTANCWYFLAENFSTYFRMMLVHLGLNHWQLKFTLYGVTPCCQRAIAIAVPHLLHENCNVNSNSDNIVHNIPRNIINANIFKIGLSSSKMSKSSATKSYRNTK